MVKVDRVDASLLMANEKAGERGKRGEDYKASLRRLSPQSWPRFSLARRRLS